MDKHPQEELRWLLYHFSRVVYRVSRILGKWEWEAGMGNILDKGYHVNIYSLDFAAQCFFAALLDPSVKISNRALNHSNRAVKNVWLIIRTCIESL